MDAVAQRAIKKRLLNERSRVSWHWMVGKDSFCEGS